MNVWVKCLSSRLDLGLLLVGEDGELDLASDQAAALLGLDEDEEGERWRELRDRIGAAVTDVWRTGRRTETELEVETDGETRRLAFDVLAVDEDDCRGHIVLVRDAGEAAALGRDLRMASQMRSLSRLYRSMAHDLRAPLNAMVVNLELLQDAVAPGAAGENLAERRRRYARVLKEEMERLNRYLQAFLTQTAPESEGNRRLDLRQQLADLVQFVEPQARKQKVELDPELPDRQVWVYGSADQLRQAVLGLVVNALEAQPEGGWIGIGLEETDGRVRVWVEDEGPGIPPRYRAQIFAMHFTTKDGGSGIGLSVARDVAERHGGDLTVGSAEPGEGTRFTLDLPAAPPEEA